MLPAANSVETDDEGPIRIAGGVAQEQQQAQQQQQNMLEVIEAPS